MTDQQRAVQHFPGTWVQHNLVNLMKLTSNGLTFTNAIINASRCSPSRGVLATGLYAPKNQLVGVGGTLPVHWTTLTSRIQATGLGYQIGYVGKWHMTSSFFEASNTVPNPASTLEAQNAQLLDQYGTPGWDAPDAGTAVGWSPSTPPSRPPTVSDPYRSTSNTLGGGPNSYRRNDARIAQDAIAFLKNLDPTRPFALIVSLVNPHDVWVDMFSGLIEQAYPEFPAAFAALPGADQFQLPDSYARDHLSTKPEVQAQTRASYTAQWAAGNGVSPVPTKLDAASALNYLRFYAYLTYLADQQLDAVYQQLTTMPQFADTLVVRLADHGELGMSHGGGMQKDCNVYAETINIPYIFSNPRLYRAPVTCAAQAGLVDIVPTLLGLLGHAPSSSEVQGTDLSALLLDPAATPPTSCSIFTYDEDGTWHIRAIQAAPGAVSVNGVSTKSAYKYAVYYRLDSNGGIVGDDVQYELYIPGEGGEIVNLQMPELEAALHTLLTERMVAIDTTGPSGGGTVTPPGWTCVSPQRKPRREAPRSTPSAVAASPGAASSF